MKDDIFAFITTLKLTEKEIRSMEDEAAKWQGRIDLARSRGMNDLLTGAEREAEAVRLKLVGLREEAEALRKSIETMRLQLPGLAARERTVDPDFLEQELLAALGKTEEEAAADRAFGKLEKDNAADAALEELKAKLKDGNSYSGQSSH
jgi:phage shock protein A